MRKNQHGYIGTRANNEEESAEIDTLSTADKSSGEKFETVGEIASKDPIISVRNCNVYYGDVHAINNVSLDIGRNEVISLIGPSGCCHPHYLR